jgi:haloalkane dehalogenase
VFGERNHPLGFQEQWAGRFGDITQVTVPAGNHFPMCDDPDLVAQAIADWHALRVRYAPQSRGERTAASR